MNINKRLSAFAKLGRFLNSIYEDSDYNSISKELFLEIDIFNEFIIETKNSTKHNAWFTENYIKLAILSIAANLNEKDLKKWILNEDLINADINREPKNIGVVLPGNIPLVGFHDFLCVLISGNKFIGKLSSNDKYLLPAISNVLINIEPGFKDYITFTENYLSNADAIIATGSNNSSRYFEYYFSKYSHIIRRNRNSIAVLNGNETLAELKELCKDIFLYYGLGCRNVSKIYVPLNYSFNNLLIAAEDFNFITENSKYFNNYNFNKAILVINKTKHIDNGFVLFKEGIPLYSPVSIINYEYYKDVNTLKNIINSENENIQCVVSNDASFDSAIRFGTSQNPKLLDYSDGINVIKFLQNI